MINLDFRSSLLHLAKSVKIDIVPLYWAFVLTGIALSTIFSPSSVAQSPLRPSINELFALSHQGIVIIAHRGCHEPAPSHNLGDAPENSLLALEHCVAMGVDMMETDVHMTADGYLVIMHDDTVERTTNGHGKVEDLTLADLRQLRLRRNLGGYAEAVTDQRVLTLDELLTAAKGRITLNLDVKGAIYSEVIDTVVRLGAADFVTVKTRAGIGSPALASIEPFARVPFIPILDPRGSQIADVAKRQLSSAKPVALELPHMPATDLEIVASVARRHGTKLMINTLGDGFLFGRPGDNDIPHDPEAVWGWQYRKGISVFQTDRVDALLVFRKTLDR